MKVFSEVFEVAVMFVACSECMVEMSGLMSSRRGTVGDGANTSGQKHGYIRGTTTQSAHASAHVEPSDSILTV